MKRTGLKTALGIPRATCLPAVGAALLAAGVLGASGLGCATPEGYRVSKRLMQEENYDQAVIELRKLVAKDPANSQYQIRLAEAESQAADRHVSRAKECRAGHRPRDAQEELRIALDQVPAHPEAIAMIQEVEEEIRAATKLAEQAQTALDRADFKDAVRLAEQALRIDQTLRATQQVRDKARASAVRIHRDRAHEALEARQWDTCLAEAAKIRELDGSEPAAAAIEKQVTNRQRALSLLESARGAIREKDHAAAIGPLREAASLWPEDEEISGERDRATRIVVEQLVTRAQAELMAAKFATAIDALDRALSISPTDQSVIKRRQDATARWAESLLEQYERRALAGEWEHAWRPAIQAAVLFPAVRERVSQDLSRAEDKIRQNIAYNMSVLPLKSATVGTEGALAVCHALIEELGRIKPAHVQLLERTNLSQILTEHDLSLANISDAARLTDLERKLPGTDVFLFVDVSARESQDRRDQPPGTSKYLAGKQNVRNPDYAKAEQTLEQKKKAFDRARSQAMFNETMWDASGRRDLRSEQSFLRKAVTGYYGLKSQRAAEDYNVALMKLHDTPQRIERDHWQQHQYPVYRVEREVSVKVRLRLIEVATGRILWSDNESIGRAADADTLIEPDNTHNVPGKTAVLKAMSELQAEAIERVIPALHVKVRELLSRRSAACLEDAQKSTGEAAVENYVRFLFDCGTRPEPRAVALALDELFSADVSGTTLDECKRLAADRLGLATHAAATPPGGQTAVAAAPAAPPAPRGTKNKVLTPTQPAEHVASPPAPLKALALQAKGPQQIARTIDIAKPVRVLEAIVSRDDDRYQKQLRLNDGITVKVSDTDKRPLDADLEIRVGSRRRKYKDLRVGAKIPVRGLGGGRYEIIILAIEDPTETVRFALDRLEQPSPRRSK